MITSACSRITLGEVCFHQRDKVGRRPKASAMFALGTLTLWYSASSTIVNRNRMRPLAYLSTIAMFLVVVGCSYRLPAATLGHKQRVKIVARSSERLTVRLHLYEPRDCPVPASGRLTLDIPTYRAACRTYLFDKLRLARGADPYLEKRVELLRGSSRVRKMSLKEISQLPRDA